ncbi:MAG: ABC transporter substrate-binding protein [Granulosicoccus sp.]
MRAQVTHKEFNGIGSRNVIEQLTRLDPETNEVLPMLALSWEQIEPTVWHFDLRQGVTFHDGSVLDAEAAAVSINWLWSPENSYVVRDMMGPQITAEVVDDDTVAVMTDGVDPLLSRRMYLGGITSARQILEEPDDHNVHRGRDRNAGCRAPLAQIPASAANAPGSCLEYWRQSELPDTGG